MRYLRWASMGLLLVTLIGVFMGPPVGVSPGWASQSLVPEAEGEPFRHDLWASVLKQVIRPGGQIDRIRGRQSPQALTAYLAQLEAQSPQSHPKAFPTPYDQTAYWLNAYNAMALKAVLDAYPHAVMRDPEAFLTQRRFRLGNVPMSLRDIDPHIRAAITETALAPWGLSQGTLDSPMVLRQPFQGKVLSRQLRWLVQQTLVEMRPSPLVWNDSAQCLGIRAPETLTPFLDAIQATLGTTALGITPTINWPALLPSTQAATFQQQCPTAWVPLSPNKRFRLVPEGSESL